MEPESPQIHDDSLSPDLQDFVRESSGFSPTEHERAMTTSKRQADFTSNGHNAKRSKLSAESREEKISNEEDSQNAQNVFEYEDVTIPSCETRDAQQRKRRGSKASWNQRFQELKAYRLEHGDCLVPYVYHPNTALGRWVANQRTQYRYYMNAKQDGTTDSYARGMNEERIALLEAEGFIWNTGVDSEKCGKQPRAPSSIDSWDQRFQELQDFKKSNGHCNVPTKYKPNPALGHWVTRQRDQYRLYMEEQQAGNSVCARSSMTEDRVAKLGRLGFSWTLQVRNSWEERLEQLKAYKEDRGTCDVPWKHPLLGRWVSTQRTLYRKYMKARQAGKSNPSVKGIDEERIAEMESLGFTWGKSKK